MKHLFYAVSAFLLTTVGHCYAQSDQANLDKYWKFRNDFREKFVRIGPLQGQSLPAGALKPLDCVDNDTNTGVTTPYGEMHWGDGMIRHGHYLGLLATEYKLLKNSGADVTGVLNELYYALLAINRLDYSAEEQQDVFYNMTLSANQNGFLLREDVGEDFATSNWSTDPMRMACTNSAFYSNNNYAKVDNNADMEVKFNTYQNTPSLDQLSSLMVGLSLIHKLVDDIYVKPAPSDAGFQVVTETKAIVHRLISYASSHNWLLIDVNGWPVNSGGGDLVLTAVPLSIAATRITNQLYPLEMSRRLIKYRDIQGCATGYGLNAELTSQERFEICSGLGTLEQLHYSTYMSNSGQAGPFNNQNISEFQTWQFGGTSLTGIQNALLEAWPNLIPTGSSGIDQLFEDMNAFIASDADLLAYSDLFNLGLDEWNMADYTETIMFNCGVASQMWDPAQVVQYSDHTNNTQLELIDCIIKGIPPARPQSWYRAKMDPMSILGPYQLKGMNWDSDTNNIYSQTNFAGYGWASEYRWTHPNESLGNHGDVNGIYSALDYMLYHNLYRLAFMNTVSTETNYQCSCNGAPTVAPPAGANSYQLDANANLNQKLAFLPVCPSEVLSPVSHIVSTSYNIEPKFPEYVDFKIFTTKFQRSDATVQSSGDLHVRTRYVQCSGTTTIESGGKMTIEKAETVVNPNAVLDVSGEIHVKSGTTLTIRGKLVLRQGSVLDIEDGAKLNIAGGTIEYYNGADFFTRGTTSEVALGGEVKAMNATTFEIGTTQPSNSLRGKLILSGATKFTALQPSTFHLYGKGKAYEYITVLTTPSFNDANATVRITECTVRMNQSAGITSISRFQASGTKFISSVTNAGITVRADNYFSICDFQNVILYGNLTAPGNTFKLEVNGSAFVNGGVFQNNDNFLVKVTGGGYALSTSTFTTATGNMQVYSTGMTLPSAISSCTFTQNATGNHRSVIAIHDYSNIEITVKSSNFNQLATGILKQTGKLTLKCNTFENSKTNNISAKAGALVNMSSSTLGGYNVLNPPTSGSSILLYQSSVALNNGYNYINDGGSHFAVSGTLTNSCTPPGCLVYVTKNQWNSGNTVPSAAKFQLYSSQGYTMLVIPSPVAAKPACGYYDAPPVGDPGGGTSGRPGNGPDETGTKSTHDADGMPRIWYEMANDSVRLDDAVLYGISRSTAYDSTGSDLEAIEVFDQVFKNDLDLSDSITISNAWLAFESMKTALENAFADGFLTQYQNEAVFEGHVGMYANALMVLTDSVIDTDNYLTQFYHEFDKAHLFRVIGHPEIGLSILNELEFCGIDSVQQAQLNDWKIVFQTDMLNELHINSGFGDTVFTIDTSSFINPSTVINAYSFGAQIISLNDISYPNCNFYNSKFLAAKANRSMRVFPNPASNEVNVLFPDHMTGIGKLIARQPDGRNKLAISVDLSKGSQQINVLGWAAGIYNITLISSDGNSFSCKLVVQ